MGKYDIIYSNPIMHLLRLNASMTKSLAFILEELQTKSLSDDFRNEIISTCQDFQQTLIEVHDKIKVLEDKLGIQSAELSDDPNKVNPEIEVLIESIRSLINEKIEVMHQLVMKYRTLSEQDNDKFGSVSSLLTCLGADILAARAATQQELSFISDYIHGKGLIGELVMYDIQTEEGYNTLSVTAQGGDVYFVGVDAGPDIKARYGDWDYEYWMTVPKQYKDTMLLYLLKEHFSHFDEIKSWIESKSIPTKYTYYA